ncbi:PhzF family phenazine biosynthesis protein [Corynebacterium guangdongense]|uniref:PhzF family phenazine biosynthesis protein n=1 Tax=Corynebacterium guangdongense TaxID=1783348 RepID=A0ABU2A0F3_9CORY|nr:PhzF family phenazine biosynthesis protein [Corynebacterium guangdongense]MDR7330654.1 PhzF family phenazine biosynthesis protein [Corynebacterium guangdongense]WJZ16670.1 Trans-2,3-dihydro-3-hydroxyanthranilate isomerase [Corynebacterium guangdongense]
MAHKFLEIDVFATGPFTGNPLAVIADADDLSTGQMRAIARWLNLSETTFLLTPTTEEADYRVRIFTPTEEFPFAGHPTLGSARAWLELGGIARGGRVVQECGVGLVPVRVDGEMLSFATPPRTRTGPLSDAELERAAQILGVGTEEILAHAWGVNGPTWQLIQLADADAVRALRPAGDRTGAHLGVVGLAPSVREVEVRAILEFGEDPVTGSLNGALAQWLRERGVIGPDYVARQGSAAGADGEVFVHDDGADIWVGGRTAVRISGTLAM